MGPLLTLVRHDLIAVVRYGLSLPWHLSLAVVARAVRLYGGAALFRAVALRRLCLLMAWWLFVVAVFRCNRAVFRWRGAFFVLWHSDGLCLLVVRWPSVVAVLRWNRAVLRRRAPPSRCGAATALPPRSAVAFRCCCVPLEPCRLPAARRLLRAVVPRRLGLLVAWWPFVVAVFRCSRAVLRRRAPLLAAALRRPCLHRATALVFAVARDDLFGLAVADSLLALA